MVKAKTKQLIQHTTFVKFRGEGNAVPRKRVSARRRTVEFPHARVCSNIYCICVSRGGRVAYRVRSRDVSRASLLPREESISSHVNKKKKKKKTGWGKRNGERIFPRGRHLKCIWAWSRWHRARDPAMNDERSPFVEVNLLNANLCKCQRRFYAPRRLRAACKSILSPLAFGESNLSNLFASVFTLSAFGYPVLNCASVFFFTSFSSLPRKLIAYVNFIRMFLRSLYFSDFHIHFVEFFTHETLSPLLMWDINPRV